jgi:hypothetical protein
MLKIAVENYLIGLIRAAHRRAVRAKKLRRIRVPALRMDHVEPLLQFWQSNCGVPLGKHDFSRVYHIQKAKNATCSQTRERSPVMDALSVRPLNKMVFLLFNQLFLAVIQ